MAISRKWCKIGSRLLLITSRMWHMVCQIRWKSLTLDHLKCHWPLVWSAVLTTAGLLVKISVVWSVTLAGHSVFQRFFNDLVTSDSEDNTAEVCTMFSHCVDIVFVFCGEVVYKGWNSYHCCWFSGTSLSLMVQAGMVYWSGTFGTSGKAYDHFFSGIVRK